MGVDTGQAQLLLEGLDPGRVQRGHGLLEHPRVLGVQSRLQVHGALDQLLHFRPAGLRVAQGTQQVLCRPRFAVEGDTAAGGGLEEAEVHARVPDAYAHLGGTGVRGDGELPRGPDVGLDRRGTGLRIDHRLQARHNGLLQGCDQFDLQTRPDDGAHQPFRHCHVHVARHHVDLLLEAALDQGRVEQFHLTLEGLDAVGHLGPVHGAVALAHLFLHPGRIAPAGLLLGQHRGHGAGGGARAGLVLQGLQPLHQGRHGRPVTTELRQGKQRADIAPHRGCVLDVKARQIVAQVLLQRLGQSQHLGARRVQVLAGQLVELDDAPRQLLGRGDDLPRAGGGRGCARAGRVALGMGDGGSRQQADGERQGGHARSGHGGLHRDGWMGWDGTHAAQSTSWRPRACDEGWIQTDEWPQAGAAVQPVRPVRRAVPQVVRWASARPAPWPAGWPRTAGRTTRCLSRSRRQPAHATRHLA